MYHQHRQLGPLGLFLFMLVGAIATYLSYAKVYLPAKHASLSFIETSCLIVDKKLEKTHSSDQSYLYSPSFFVRYTVNGEVFQTWTYRLSKSSSSDYNAEKQLLNRYAKDAEYPCWYDPENIATAVLNKELTIMDYLPMVLSALFFLAGFIGLVIKLTSARN